MALTQEQLAALAVEALEFPYSQLVFTLDQSPGAGRDGTGLVIVDPTFTNNTMVLPNVTGAGFIVMLTADQANTVANLSIGADKKGSYVYTAIWGPGSTHATTSVVCGFTYMMFAEAIWAYVMDPDDPTGKTGATGTYNFPVTIVSAPDTPFQY